MCRPVACKQCGKTTWAGCGQHVDQVKATVAPGQWCNGHDGNPSAKANSNSSSQPQGGFFARLFGR